MPSLNMQSGETKITDKGMKNYHITHKSLKSSSTSEWSVIMKIINNNLAKLEDTNILLANSPELGNTLLANSPELGNTLLANSPELGNTEESSDNTNQVLLVDIMSLLDKIVIQINIDNKLFNDGILDKISDCALHAPRDTPSSKNKPIRPSYYCAKKMFIDTGKMPKQEWANIHWQRLVAKLSRTFIEQEKLLAMLADEFKTARLLQHQRRGWCELKRTIAIPVGRPTAMKVDISPLEELEPFFQHLAADGIMYRLNSTANQQEHLEFTRGAVYPDGRMDLCKQVVGPTWIGALMNALKSNTKVEHFLLGNNITNLEGGRAIGEFLATPHPNKIKTWYLAGSDFSSKALEYIVAGFLASNDNDISALWLKRNPLYAEGMHHIRKLLESNKSLKVLDLHNIAIGLKEQAFSDETNNFERHITDNGIKELCEGLKVNEVLENLYLGANALTQSSMNYLADYFQFKVNHCRPGIKSIWLDMNKMTDEGCHIICEALKNYPIRGLEIGSNFISEAGMADITRCFRNHSTLEVLRLGLYKATADMGVATNNISDAGVPAICELIENNTSIRHLDISMNNISNEGMSLITASLEKNTTLWYMSYKQYGHETDQKNIDKIADLLERNRAPYRHEIEFNKNHERRFIHGDNIWTIDSIYRNSMK